MTSRPNEYVVAAAALVLLWCVGLFGRGYWTPDEPREAALAASVSIHPAPLPTLAGAPFAEKPPLTYWLAGASMRLFGANPAAARAPQLCYALLGFIALMMLARTLLGSDSVAPTVATAAAAFTAAMLFATSELVYQVQIWLDTDALLLAGVCVALAGMYGALAAPAHADAAARSARLRSYLVMHLGLTLAFFGKNFAAWLVPALAFLAFVAWERRWRELRRWELYLGALLPATCIALWVMAVWTQPGGAQSLRVLFWANLVGRALSGPAMEQFNYSSGHQNWAGKYLLELPLNLLPWTVLLPYALKAAWRGARVPGPRRPAWRFALCVALPGLLALSLAATARGIYAAPCMIGFALLIALWAVDGPGARRALSLTALLIALLALAVLALTVALQWTVERSAWPLAALSIFVAAAVAVWCLRQCYMARPAPAMLVQLAAAWGLLLSLGILSLFSAINRLQDVAALAQRVASTADGRPILLWRPDETTLAWAQLYLPEKSWSALNVGDDAADAGLAQSLCSAPQIVVVSMSPRAKWTLAQWLRYLRGRTSAAALSLPLVAAGQEPALLAAGFVTATQVVRPGGRGYLFWQHMGTRQCGK